MLLSLMLCVYNYTYLGRPPIRDKYPPKKHGYEYSRNYMFSVIISGTESS